ncbi:MAG: NADH-quinone oxidoreductase subunit M [gamma proteobacterium symbiont of Bathyaustriella thionipta]|nr:NADH-quinone oxidoreductase subunit M [gamma proteobacterium symbiont of Bathyaustriella thionipta]MCU7949555.1 NADH-quinone oxidoreductase subunit M [gamma proteobacterium symbiont of Bathyaustriella thionipta]MCU7953015.1 NADH-quinone oxidoreductase subunit M [gamma proteobacterium symbiont of Bathyaustriella thionipta]MCU7956726.1 NADH-quinone oxidoreductase subunit M [gamma proteobacterium symbiont of Bathyaustriella thionipta]MCU7967572.1 NADH-quinone oxidoreductase subunit M [gamma pro
MIEVTNTVVTSTGSTIGTPVLSLLLFILPIAAGFILLTSNQSKARWIALTGAIGSLFVSLGIVINFDQANAGFQFVERLAWMPGLNIDYIVGVDGISVLFLPLTSLLFIGIILASWNSIRTMPRLFFILILLLEAATLGIFVSLNTILFFLFWELTLIPIYFLIIYWGIGPNRRYAAVKYTMVMMAGGVPLLFGFILLAFNHAYMGTGELVFDYISLLNNPLPPELQTSIFFLLLLGFAFKAPIFPLHTWLPAIAMEGPASIAAIMTGLKLGAYGLIRFTVPLAPDAALEFHWLLAGLGITGVLYGAVLAITQTNLRKMLAFSSVSHVGLVILGIASFSTQGIQGALFQLYNFTIVAGGIFILLGFLHHRTGSTELVSLGGVAKTMPLLASFFFIFGLAGLGVPGTNGFIAENLILVSTLKAHTGAGIAALIGMVLAAAYFLNIYQRAFLGPVKNDVVSTAMDLRSRELLLTLLLCVLIVIFGIFPNIILDITRSASEAWVNSLAS